MASQQNLKREYFMNQKVLPAKFLIENSAAFCRASRLDLPIPTPIFLPQNHACKEKHRLNAQSTKITHLRKGSIGSIKITEHTTSKSESLVIANMISVKKHLNREPHICTRNQTWFVVHLQCHGIYICE